MIRAEYQVEFVTPCFLGGADPSAAAEWRAASIRGQLRWWFRAVAGGFYSGNFESMKSHEQALFGATSKSSSIRIRTIGNSPTYQAARSSSFGRPFDERALASAWADSGATSRLALTRGRSNPIAYLGFGCIDSSGLPIRPWLAPETLASLILQTNSLLEGSLFPETLWAWLNLGGIGAKCRRGFGSLVCVKGENLGNNALSFPCSDLSQFKAAIRTLFQSCCKPGSAKLPEWSHFSSQSAIYIGRGDQGSWEDAMALIGSWLIGFRRRYGNNSDARSLSGIPLAGRDYEWASPHASDRKGAIPDRAGFGLPLPFGPGGETVSWGVIPRYRSGQGVPDNRRASPLLIHIGRFKVNGRRRFFPVLTYLPARLIPPDENLIFKSNPAAGYNTQTRHYEVLKDFLDDLLAKNLIEEVR